MMAQLPSDKFTHARLLWAELKLHTWTFAEPKHDGISNKRIRAVCEDVMALRDSHGLAAVYRYLLHRLFLQLLIILFWSHLC